MSGSNDNLMMATLANFTLQALKDQYKAAFAFQESIDVHLRLAILVPNEEFRKKLVHILTDKDRYIHPEIMKKAGFNAFTTRNKVKVINTLENAENQGRSQ